MIEHAFNLNPTSKMIKHLRYTCYLLLLAGVAHSQEKTGKGKLFPQKPGIIINTTFNTLIEPDAGPTLGVEYRISNHFAVGMNVTGIFYAGTPIDRTDSARMGFRLQPEIKYFVNWGDDGDKQVYFSLMGLHKEMKYKAREHDTTNTSTFRIIDRKKIINAMSGNIGVQHYLGDKRHFIVDVYAGMGLRYRSTTPPLPVYNTEGAHYDFTTKDGYTLQVSFGIKLGYRF
jgi:hypothetical protein